MKYIFLAIFIVSTAFHLYASLRKETKKRNISKPFIILSLLGFYVLAARQVSAAIVIALILSWIGDVLLIPKGIKWFTAGGISFMIGHFFFILGYLKDIDFASIPVFLIILLAIFFTAAVLFIFSKLKPHKASLLSDVTVSADKRSDELLCDFPQYQSLKPTRHCNRNRRSPVFRIGFIPVLCPVS